MIRQWNEKRVGKGGDTNLGFRVLINTDVAVYFITQCNKATHLDRSVRAGRPTPQCHGHSSNIGTWPPANTSPMSLQFDKRCGFLNPDIDLKYTQVEDWAVLKTKWQI